MSQKDLFFKDFNEGMPTKALSKKYKLSMSTVYSRIRMHKKRALLGKTDAISKPSSISGINQYRTVKFPDGFMIAVAKKSTTKLVINEKGNVLIINEL